MSCMNRVVAIVCLLALAVGAGGIEAQQDSQSSLLVIFDASGSMWGQIEGENKIVIGREVLAELVDGLGEGSRFGLIAYGHRREGDCEDIETVLPMAPLDKAAAKEMVERLNPKGKTPITRSLEEAFGVIEPIEEPVTVILISDGLETCGGDPCAAVRAAKQRGDAFLLHVIGFDVAGEDVSQLECAAQAGDGLFLPAENAEQLTAALESAVTMPAEIPASRLSVQSVADGNLQDAAVLVRDSASGEDVGGGRTYADPGTNPRVIPLADGKYEVKVQAVGIKGDIIRQFQVEIVDGGTVEKTVDYSTGELSVGVTRNGELSDAVYRIRVPETGEQAAGGRTYVSSSSNPSIERLTSGTYEVSLTSTEISGEVKADLGSVTIEPGGRTELRHDFETGTLKVGVRRGSELVDAVLNIVDVESGRSVGGGRTYTSESSNPKTFILLPGEYRVDVREIRGDQSQVAATVVAGEETSEMIDLGRSEE